MTLVTDEFVCQLNNSIELYSLLEEALNSTIEEDSKSAGLDQQNDWYEVDFIINNKLIDEMYRVYKVNKSDVKKNDENTGNLFKKILRTKIKDMFIKIDNIDTKSELSKIKVFFGINKGKEDRTDNIKSVYEPFKEFFRIVSIKFEKSKPELATK
jgi:hypothetical protein